jgi:CO/xanthine dehydrogenase FAD-binding subunit
MGLLKDFRYHAPRTLKEALALCESVGEPLILAGGTFVLNFLKKSSKYPTDVIGLKQISELKGIKESSREISIGAMTTIQELSGSKIISDRLASLAAACRSLSTTPIRNMATIGGNVASRFFWADLPAVLISLDAKVFLNSGRGQKEIKIEDFLTAKSSGKEIVTRFVLPKRDLITNYFRHTKTMEVDAPSLALAFSASQEKSHLKNVRLIVNTTISHPVELKNLEAVFEANEAGSIRLDEAQKALKNDIEKTKLDEYRMHCLDVDIEDLLDLLKGTKR